MEALVIKKSWKSLSLELANVVLFLIPAIAVLYFYETSIPVLILLLIYMLFVIVCGIYVIFYLRRPNHIIISDEGLKLEGNPFYKWQELESYKILEESFRNKTAEGEVVNTTYTLVITLKNGTLLRVSTDQLNKRPKQIIAAFDERKDALHRL